MASALVDKALAAFLKERLGEISPSEVSEVLDQLGEPEASQYTADRLLKEAAAATSLPMPKLCQDWGRSLFSMLPSTHTYNLAPDIRRFVARVDELHVHFKIPQSFELLEVTPSWLTCRFETLEDAGWPFAAGFLKQAAKELYSIDLNVELQDEQVLKLSYPLQEEQSISLSAVALLDASSETAFSLPADLLCSVFPFHFVVDKHMRVVQAGTQLRQQLPGLRLGVSRLCDHTQILQPKCLSRQQCTELTLDQLQHHSHSSFVVGLLRQPEFVTMAIQGSLSPSIYVPANVGLMLKGQMVVTTLPCGTLVTSIEEVGDSARTSESAAASVSGAQRQKQQRVALFLGSPAVGSLEELGRYGLTLAELSLNDRSMDLALTTERVLADERIKEGYADLTVQLETERARSEALLSRCLPKHVAATLRAGKEVQAMAHPLVTVMFADIVGFTSMSSKMQAVKVVEILNDLYRRFDVIIDEYPDVWKANVIGDAYMLVANLENVTMDHVDQCIDLAMRLHEAAGQVHDGWGTPIQLRIGLHTGSVCSGAVGGTSSNICFSVFGDTVNTAARMESHGVPGKVHISNAAYESITDKSKYAIQQRGLVKVKGKGEMQTYIVVKHKDEWLTQHERSIQKSNRARAERAAQRSRDLAASLSREFADGSVTSSCVGMGRRAGSSPLRDFQPRSASLLKVHLDRQLFNHSSCDPPGPTPPSGAQHELPASPFHSLPTRPVLEGMDTVPSSFIFLGERGYSATRAVQDLAHDTRCAKGKLSRAVSRHSNKISVSMFERPLAPTRTQSGWASGSVWSNLLGCFRQP